MENFKEKRKLRNLVIAIGCFVLTVFCFLGAAAEAGWIPFFRPVVGDCHWICMWNGFVPGTSFGLLVLMIVGLYYVL